MTEYFLASSFQISSRVSIEEVEMDDKVMSREMGEMAADYRSRSHYQRHIEVNAK
jgi:hypothetical protein